ncbi:globin domain-containing protein [Streptomyces sp. NBC_00576]|uniref:globin domain-containing protein n=1 Tax=Streptomyces sp. NBC_00576 TaxID=2903665 RepID=UPI002E8011D5|nr:globin domain-containing protein [Streptomyces sp. NBC_00576]WUB77355.1 FAD-binding oxidoreductase [Streptomyces sp. NBC_00576]
MDAPTTTSADNGSSGGSGGSGWFKPRKQPEAPPGGEQEAMEGSRLAALRPVGRPATGGATRSSPDDSDRPTVTEPPPDPARIPAPSTPELPSTPPTPAPLPPLPLAPASPLPAPFAPARSVTGPSIRPAFAPEPQVSVPPAFATSADALESAPPASHVAPEPNPAPTTSEASRTPPAPHSDTRVPVQRPAPASEPLHGASPDAVLIRRTMEVVGPVADKATSYFYALLFVRHPELRSLFPAAMDTQRDRLLKALLTAAEHIDNTEVLVAYLQNLGRGHRKYGTRPEHYPAVGECLIGSLSRYAAAIWDQETEAAWVRAYTTMSQVMIDAAAVDELRAPAWWYGEVVSHDLRTPDIAVITVRPDQPYPFLAGQYTSLETPWWPRIWRHYSFASAPRSDGLLAFHVKAVPAGWVSNALVHRAQPGDVVRLGPPAGTMTVDHTTNSGLLCLGGGTGIAPIKALVEDVAEHGDRRRVEVFYGARTDLDLYDIDTMLRLQQSHPWLAVRAVIDQHAHLQLPDAVREYGPWYEYDAYLSGPPGMIRSGVEALRSAGFPAERIRHDSVEELVVTGS